MQGPAWGKSPPDLVDAFAAAIADLPGSEPRKMFGFPAAFVNGHLFTGLFEDRWFVRLPEADRAELAGTGAAAFEPMPGRPMRDYVELPAAFLADEAARDSWLRRSLDHVASLPPKEKKPKKPKKR
jgi:TfoX/Sxy family transcriptional regulator of competence genes